VACPHLFVFLIVRSTAVDVQFEDWDMDGAFGGLCLGNPDNGERLGKRLSAAAQHASSLGF
jgi:hypothetical protein